MRPARLRPLALLALLGGCSLPVMYLPFRDAPGPRQAEEASKLRGTAGGPVSVWWSPPDFPRRVDVQAASGFVGGASRQGVAIGPVLSRRVAAFLDAAVGLDPASRRVVAITVVEARTSFAFRPDGRALDRGECTLKVRVDVDGRPLEETYYSSDTLKGTPASRASVLDDVLDEVAAMLARDVVRKLSEAPPP